MRKDKMNRNTNADATQVYDGDTTQVYDGDATQVYDGDATQVYDGDATQVYGGDARSVKTLDEIVKGDVIQGYKVGNLLSEKGGEASIRFAEKGGKKYVIKVFRSGREIDNRSEDALVDLKSPYVMPILDRGEFKGIHYEILPFYHNGTFGNLLGKGASLDRLMMFIGNVNEGLRAIHGVNVFHNDIKPENVFLSDDMKYAVIGDFGISRFGADRTHVTNIGNMSKYYAAPEADEMSNEKTDYFSFGMSVADIAFGKKLFEGLTGKQARQEIISGRLSLPAEIPEDVRDLITMLTQYNPQDRITYDGVIKWLSDPKCFAGCRDRKERTDKGLSINLYRFGEKGNKTDCLDTYRLAEAMNDNQALAVHQQEFILNAIKTAPQQDPQLYEELSQIFAKYKNDLPFGLFLMLHTLNPHLTVKFAGKEMSDFRDYIDMLERDYGKVIDAHFARDEFINVLLNHGNMREETKDLIRSVTKTYNTAIDRIDMLLNLFGKTKKFYCDNVVYDGFGEFLDKKAFSDNGCPNAMKWEKSRKEFLSVYLDKLCVESKTVKDILDEKNRTTEYFMLGKTINGYIPLRLCGAGVKNLYDLVELIARKKEQGNVAELNVINGFLSNGGFSEIVRFEKTPVEKGLTDIINSADNKVSHIYYYCYRDSKFSGCSDVSRLIALLGSVRSDEIERRSGEILASEDFKIWMAKQGVRI